MNNREIKFRVWDKLLNKFIPWNCFIPFDNDREYIIQQYTGLKDKDGQEIYEGDIIQYENRLGHVKFYSGIFFCCWDDQTDDELGYMKIDEIQMIDTIPNYEK